MNGTLRLRGYCLGALLLALPACVRFGYGVTHLEEPVPHDVLVSLQPFRDDLGSCLQRLGAPHFVWEYRGDGIAIGWYFSDGSDLDLDIGYSPREFTNTSFSLDWDETNLPGAVLWFDGDLKLLEWREGNMRDLTTGLRQRPSPVDDG